MARVISPGHRNRDGDEHLAEELDRWVEAAVITTEQADAIRALEETRETRPRAGIPIVAEALGFLGGALAAVAGIIAVSRFWDDLSTPVRLAIVGTVGLLLLGAGRVVRRGDEPALERLGSFLWAIATGCAAFFTSIVCLDVFNWEGIDVTLAVGLASFVVALALWVWRPAPLQHAATLAAAAVTAAAFAGHVEHVDGRFVGVALWTVGVTWAALAWMGVVRPVPLGYALGGGLAIIAGQAMSGDLGGVAESILAVGTALAFLAASVPAGSLALLWVGVIGVFISVPAAVTRHFGSSDAAPIALFVTGMTLIATAVVASRLLPHVKARRAAAPRLSRRSSATMLFGGIAVVAAVMLATTPFTPVPKFASLQATPDPAITGTVAFIRGTDHRCVFVVTASGAAERKIGCAHALGLNPNAVRWNSAGNLVAESWDRNSRNVEINATTGKIIGRNVGSGFDQKFDDRSLRASDNARVSIDMRSRGKPRLIVESSSGARHTVFATKGPLDYHFSDAAWSPDGHYAVVADSEARLLVVDVAATHPSARLLATNANAPAWG